MFEEEGQPKQRMEPRSSVYQPNALPLGQTGSQGNKRSAASTFIEKINEGKGRIRN